MKFLNPPLCEHICWKLNIFLENVIFLVLKCMDESIFLFTKKVIAPCTCQARRNYVIAAYLRLQSKSIYVFSADVFEYCYCTARTASL